MSFVLLFSIIGININKHYSDSKVHSISVFTEQESCCTEDMCDCCNETTQSYYITDVFLPSVFQLNHNKVIHLKKQFANYRTNLVQGANRQILSEARALKYFILNAPEHLQCFRL